MLSASPMVALDIPDKRFITATMNVCLQLLAYSATKILLQLAGRKCIFPSRKLYYGHSLLITRIQSTTCTHSIPRVKCQLQILKF